MAFVTMKDAYVYVDSRYFLSAAKEIPEGFTMLKRESDWTIFFITKIVYN